MLRRVLDGLCAIQGLTCREATRLAANAMDRRLAFRERMKLCLHKLLCSYCRDYGRQLRFLRKCLRRLSISDHPPSVPEIPPASASRIKKRLESEISRSE
jgi:hypothetical protein